MDTEATRYVANPVVSCGDEQDGAILFNPDTDDMVVINPTGRLLWDLLQTPQGIAEMAARLAETYPDVSLEQATQDAQAFVDELLGDFVQEGQADDDH